MGRCGKDQETAATDAVRFQGFGKGQSLAWADAVRTKETAATAAYEDRVGFELEPDDGNLMTWTSAIKESSSVMQCSWSEVSTVAAILKNRW